MNKGLFNGQIFVLLVSVLPLYSPLNSISTSRHVRKKEWSEQRHEALLTLGSSVEVSVMSTELPASSSSSSTMPRLVSGSAAQPCTTLVKSTLLHDPTLKLSCTLMFATRRSLVCPGGCSRAVIILIVIWWSVFWTTLAGDT